MALVAPFIFFAMLLAESGLGICIVRAERVTVLPIAAAQAFRAQHLHEYQPC